MLDVWGPDTGITASGRAGDADEVALRVGEVADDDATVLIEGGTHDPGTAEAFGFLQSRLDVGDPDVEESMAFVGGAPSDPARDSGAISGCDLVDEGIAVRLGDFRCHRGVLLVGPAEELAVVVPEPRRIGPDDLEVDDRIGHSPTLSGARPRRTAVAASPGLRSSP